MKHELRFQKEAYEQLEEWRRVSPMVFKKIGELIKAIDETPNSGIGKPEAFKKTGRDFGREKSQRKIVLFIECRATSSRLPPVNSITTTNSS
jgi:Txe/YoeB family toxin of Txe-Axe toxin-antitoxin module